MPLQNRVTPWSAIEASPGRGLFTGNRGCLHDDQRRLVTQGWRTKAWICCTLDWRGWRRTLMTPRRWTELFFLDEATALAAGHRPCAYCRRGDYNAFMAAWAETHSQPDKWRAAAVDTVLHPQRTARTPVPTRLGDLPDGALVEREGQAREAWLTADGRLLRWSQEGYRDAAPLDPSETVLPVTPPSMLAVLIAGYRPVLHPSASAS